MACVVLLFSRYIKFHIPIEIRKPDRTSVFVNITNLQARSHLCCQQRRDGLVGYDAALTRLRSRVRLPLLVSFAFCIFCFFLYLFSCSIFFFSCGGRAFWPRWLHNGKWKRVFMSWSRRLKCTQGKPLRIVDNLVINRLLRQGCSYVHNIDHVDYIEFKAPSMWSGKRVAKKDWQLESRRGCLRQKQMDVEAPLVV